MIMLQSDWQKEYQFAGGFKTALMRAIELADKDNLEKLAREYPELVDSFVKFSVGTVEK